MMARWDVGIRLAVWRLRYDSVGYLMDTYRTSYSPTMTQMGKCWGGLDHMVSSLPQFYEYDMMIPYRVPETERHG